MNLDELRKRIDEIDSKIVAFLNERCKTVQEIGELKKNGLSAIYVPERERLVYEKVRRLNSGPMPDTALCAIYREIMSGSFALERPLRIAYPGGESSFTHLAALFKFGNSVAYAPCGTVAEVVEKVAAVEADYACVAVGGFIEGVLPAAISFFAAGEVAICAEIHGRDLVVTSMKNDPDNTSRFIILGRQFPRPTGKDKTTICFSLADRPGALCDGLLPFKDEKITLNIAGSRPGVAGSGDYFFFVDIPGHIEDEAVKRAIAKLRLVAKRLLILGSYPRGLESV